MQRRTLLLAILATTLSLIAVRQRTQAQQAGSPSVHGSGTVTRVPLWIGTTPSGDSLLGDSIITQSNGNIGIDLATPASKLSVPGMIQTTIGGYKFPDDSVQTTAGLTSVLHDSTLTGDGKTSSLLGVSVPLSLSGISSSELLRVTNSGTAGPGISSRGGNGGNNRGGDGMNAYGGPSFIGQGGSGVGAYGGNTTGLGGDGVTAVGGNGGNMGGGAGVRASGGRGVNLGGVGVFATGGETIGSAPGGTGIIAVGGLNGVGSTLYGPGGTGIQSVGGASEYTGGTGLVAAGGESIRTLGGNNYGGTGIVVTGGKGRTTNLADDTTGGPGLIATGGEAGGAFFGKNYPGAGVIATGGVTLDSQGHYSGPGGYGIVATGGPGLPSGSAGLFHGNVDIDGSLSVVGVGSAGNITATGTKNFKIDHPLDPENKYLLHASVESSEVLNIYSGNVVTDAKGETIVTLPDWFEALNRDVRYQLTVIGAFAQAIVAEKINRNRFTIRTSVPNVEVSWQVTGVRADAQMQKHPFQAEEMKPESDRGTYLAR
jgi:trimeric autotransporter adhesin